jgi:hypothetical protein
MALSVNCRDLIVASRLVGAGSVGKGQGGRSAELTESRRCLSLNGDGAKCEQGQGDTLKDAFHLGSLEVDMRKLMFDLCAYIEELRDISDHCERIVDDQKCVQCREKERVIEKLSQFLKDAQVPENIIRHYAII